MLLYVRIHSTCLHWPHFLYEIGIWLKTKRKKKNRTVRIRFVQVVCCNFSYTNFNVYIEKIIKHTKNEAGGPNIRAITPKCPSGSKASVSFPNDSLLPLYRSLYFIVARASVAQEQRQVCLKIVGGWKCTAVYIWKCQKCSEDCTIFRTLKA